MIRRERIALFMAVLFVIAMAADALAVAVLTAEPYVLPPSPKRDPFTDPRSTPPPPPGKKDTTPEIKTPADLELLTVDSIIGREDTLKAVVSGTKLGAGEEIKLQNVTLKVTKITKDTVELKCVKADKKFAHLKDKTFTRKIVE